jgi:predicted metal-dependent phosphoesterase TrpH
MEWPKGSNWRKWDLHVHSPASHQFAGVIETNAPSVFGHPHAVESFASEGCQQLGIAPTVTL